MSKSKKIEVQGVEITVVDQDSEDYISLTDMLKAKDGNFFIDNWLRNRNTLEFLSVWETINNPDFNYVEFDVIKSKAGLNSLLLMKIFLFLNDSVVICVIGSIMYMELTKMLLYYLIL